MMMFENYATIIAVIAGGFGSVMSFSYFMQAYRAWKRKSVENLSIWLFTVMFIGTAIWLLYGFSINSLPILVANTIGLFGLACIIVLYFKYKKKREW